jgi:phosphopantetheinyl transferase
MPLFTAENIDDSLLGLWEITETPKELRQMVSLTPAEEKEFRTFTNSRRQREWLATRALLQKMLEESFEICHLMDGKPVLENTPYHISISHSTEYAAVLLHKKMQTGIDIENVSRSINKVAPRFLSAEELQNCLTNDGYSNIKLFMHWCAKEAIFKMIPHQGVEFSTQIQIPAFEMTGSNGSFTGLFRGIFGTEHIDLNYRFIEDNLMVWGLYE